MKNESHATKSSRQPIMFPFSLSVHSRDCRNFNAKQTNEPASEKSRVRKANLKNWLQ
jgi:hypothetical protein